jgi:hypothetical protein
MKKIFKMILVAIPALVVAAAVGTTTIGCGDDTTTNPVIDMAAKTGDMAHAATGDMSHSGD